MKKLLVITQKVDERDDLLGFFVSWLNELSKHFDSIEVIALGVGHYDLPQNVRVHSLGKERGAPGLVKVARFSIYLWRYSGGCSSVFAHMSPIFSILAWPVAKLRGAKLVLWYLHRSNTLKLRLAERLVDNIITADAASLRLKSQKVISVGHGIDTARFAVSRNWATLDSRPLRILSVGRISPIKDFCTLIRAAAVLRKKDMKFLVRIVGRPVMSGDHEYKQKLLNLVKELGLTEVVQFSGFIPYSDMPAQYAWADIVVGCTPTGGIDKALLEAMASGCIVLTSNTVMGPYLGDYAENLLFNHHNYEQLASCLYGLRGFQLISSGMTSSVRGLNELSVTIGKISNLL